MKIKDIIDILQVDGRKCVALSFDTKAVYYAISGSDKASYVNLIAKDIERMIGRKTIRCLIDNSFTVMRYLSGIDCCCFYNSKSQYKETEDFIYSMLHKHRKISYIFPEYFDTRVYYRAPMSLYPLYHPIEEFSCVERKIIGTRKRNGVRLYVRWNPCYKCLPAIRNVTYLDRYIKRVCRLHVKKNKTFFDIYFKKTQTCYSKKN